MRFQLISTPPKKLLDQLRDQVNLKHYSPRTADSYVFWVRQFILFHNKRHPAEMGAPDIEAFLSYLAQEGNVSSSTQNQAFNALLFLYHDVLHIELAAPIHALRAKRGQHLPAVLSKSEVNRVLDGMQGLHQLMARLLYGCGLRLMECLRLARTIWAGQLQRVVGRMPHSSMLRSWTRDNIRITTSSTAFG